MSGFIIGFLTVLLILNCLVLILLILVQLPKKDAGMGGTAFGGAATDALFGAGTGNALTKLTKYATGIFFILTLSLWIIHLKSARTTESDFKRAVESAAQPAPAKTPQKPVTGPNVFSLSNPPSTSTVPDAKPATNN